jgi:hypothetical protein
VVFSYHVTGARRANNNKMADAAGATTMFLLVAWNIPL